MQNKLTKEKALKILFQNIKDEKELLLPKNRWILHSLYVGRAAERIAKSIGINSEKALIYGYLHDIGRMINHNNHPIEGYNYLINLGFENEARICLTHSFIDNDINKTAGGGPKDKDSYDFINNYLLNHPHNVYDNIIQLCDLFCLETGFTTIEKRLLDISNRKGIYDNSLEHYQFALYLKSRIEKVLNFSLYNLFPEIDIKNINNINKDKEELLNIFKNTNKKYLLK